MANLILLVVLVGCHIGSYILFQMLGYRHQLLRKCLILSIILLSVPLLTGSILIGFLVASVAILGMLSGASSNDKVLAFFALAFALPNYNAFYFYIGFDFGGLDYVKFLSILLFIPMVLAASDKPLQLGGLTRIDKVAFWFFGFQIFVQLFGESITSALRFSFWYFVSTIFPYLAIRFYMSSQSFLLPFLGFSLAAQMAIACFESISFWKVYESIAQMTGYFEAGVSQYKIRNGFLRAEATFGNPLILALFTNFTFLLGVILLRKEISNTFKKRLAALGVLGVAMLGAFFTGSRAAMAGLFLIYIIYRVMLWSLSKPVSPLPKLIIFGVITGAIVFPFVQEFVAGEFGYRYQLIEVAIPVILENPLFGDFWAHDNPKMEVLRQGEGIIDIVNTYIYIALYSGLIGLSLYCATVYLAIKRCYSATKYAPESEKPIGMFLMVSLIIASFNLATTSPMGWSMSWIWMLIPLISNYVVRNSRRLSENDHTVQG